MVGQWDRGRVAPSEESGALKGGWYCGRRGRQWVML